jgi:hypothetical protein
MKRIFVGLISLVVLLGVTLTANAYVIQEGDAPLKVFGANWKPAMQHYFGHTDPHRLPVNAIVDPNGWKPLGYSNLQDYIPADLEIDTISASTGTIPTFYDPTVRNQTTYSTTTEELLTDGNLDNWNTIETPDYWEIYDFLSDTAATSGFAKVSGYTGYALSVDIGTSEFFPGYKMQYFIANRSDATADEETLQTIFKAKRTLGASNVAILYTADICTGEGEEEVCVSYAYNFSTNAWDEIEGGPSSLDQFEIFTLTDSWATYTGEITTTTLAGFGKIGVYLIPVGTTGDKVVFDDVQTLIDGVNSTIDGGFASWDENPTVTNPLQDWIYFSSTTIQSFDTPTNTKDSIFIDREETDTPTTTYAARFYQSNQESSRNNADYRQYIYQTNSCTPGKLLDLSFSYKNASEMMGFIYGYGILLNGSTSTYTQSFDGKSMNWYDVSGIDIRNFPEQSTTGTLNFDDNDYGSWKDIDLLEGGLTVHCPVSGEITIVFMAPNATEQSPVDFSVGAISLLEYTTSTDPANALNGFQFKYNADKNDLDQTDTLFKIETTSGTPYTYLKLDGAGAYYTSSSAFNFSSAPVKVGTPSSTNDATSKTYVDTAITDNNEYKLFATPMTANINLMATDTTSTVYTVPTGYTFYPMTYNFLITSSTNPGMVSYGSSQIGTAPNYSDIQSLAPTINTANKYTTVNFGSGAAANVYTSGQVIGLKVAVPASGIDALLVKFWLTGYLVAN